MKLFRDIFSRKVELTKERNEHIEAEHPEMSEQVDRIGETLLAPDKIVRSRTDPDVELFYRYYESTPVTEKYLCVVVKTAILRRFIVTAYFTDSVKKGEILWEKS